jgi:hypothetical protein
VAGHRRAESEAFLFGLASEFLFKNFDNLGQFLGMIVADIEHAPWRRARSGIWDGIGGKVCATGG